MDTVGWIILSIIICLTVDNIIANICIAVAAKGEKKKDEDTSS